MRGCNEAVLADPATMGWRGSEALPSHRLGMTRLGTPLGHPDFVGAQLAMFSAHHHTLLARIPMVEDVQSVRLFLVQGVSIRAIYSGSQMTGAFCQSAEVWQCFCRILQMSSEHGEISSELVP